MNVSLFIVSRQQSLAQWFPNIALKCISLTVLLSWMLTKQSYPILYPASYPASKLYPILSYPKTSKNIEIENK